MIIWHLHLLLSSLINPKLLRETNLILLISLLMPLTSWTLFQPLETISENLSLLNPAISHSAGSDLPSPKFPDVSGPEGAQRPDKTLRWFLFPRNSSVCECSPYFDCCGEYVGECVAPVCFTVRCPPSFVGYYNDVSLPGQINTG